MIWALQNVVKEFRPFKVDIVLETEDEAWLLVQGIKERIARLMDCDCLPQSVDDLKSLCEAIEKRLQTL